MSGKQSSGDGLGIMYHPASLIISQMEVPTTLMVSSCHPPASFSVGMCVDVTSFLENDFFYKTFDIFLGNTKRSTTFYEKISFCISNCHLTKRVSILHTSFLGTGTFY